MSGNCPAIHILHKESDGLFVVRALKGNRSDVGSVCNFKHPPCYVDTFSGLEPQKNGRNYVNNRRHGNYYRGRRDCSAIRIRYLQEGKEHEGLFSMSGSPERWFNSKLEDGLYKATNIVTQHLTKSLIDLRGFGLASQRVAKLYLDHAERRFYVAALVVLLQEPRLVEAKVVVHPTPQSFGATSCWVTVRLERDVRHRVMVYHGLQVIFGQVSLVCAHFLHREIASGRTYRPERMVNARSKALRSQRSILSHG